MPTILDPRRIGELLRAIDGYEGTPHVRGALRLLSLTFVRPGEVCGAAWPEFAPEAGLWRIPAERMKMREEHLVPLSRQALDVLEDLVPLTGAGRLLFPNRLDPKRGLNDSTLNAALRRMSFPSSEMVAHGFRSMASTILNESGLWNEDAIEMQLAHRKRGGGVRATYNRAKYLPERRRMMQWWADHLDTLRGSSG